MQHRIIELKLRNKLFLFLLIVPLLLAAQEKSAVILHFNDTHSRIEPLPLNDARNPNKGGVVRQDTYIRDVRKETNNKSPQREQQQQIPSRRTTPYRQENAL